MKKRAEEINLPKGTILTKEDWIDLYRTIIKFKKRVLKRQKEKLT